MPALSLSPLRFTPAETAEVVDLYVSNPEYARAAGEVHGGLRRRGIGRELVDVVERRFRAEGREGIRLAVLENHAPALAFWTSLGRHEIDRRRDVQHDRPCIVLHKPLA